MSGLMVELFLIVSLVFLLLELVSLLISLAISGMTGAGAMLMLFVLRVIFRLVEVSVLFLGLFSLFKLLQMWGVILALCSPLVSVASLGVDNLGVVRHVGRLLDGRHGPVPFELVKDGDLLLLDSKHCFTLEVWTRFGFPRSRVMLMKVWLLTVGCVNLTE